MQMDDENLQRLVELTDAELHALYEVWMTNFRDSHYMADFLFTKEGKKAWLQAEPNYPKPIIH